MPDVPQVTVFDNAFHSTMPPYAFLYGVPTNCIKISCPPLWFPRHKPSLCEPARVRFLSVDIKNTKIITCHIGNGASVAAIKYGKVIDTSMGLTPLAGVMMGSRSGDIDPSAVTYIMDKLTRLRKKWPTS